MLQRHVPWEVSVNTRGHVVLCLYMLWFCPCDMSLHRRPSPWSCTVRLVLWDWRARFAWRCGNVTALTVRPTGAWGTRQSLRMSAPLIFDSIVVQPGTYQLVPRVYQVFKSKMWPPSWIWRFKSPWGILCRRYRNGSQKRAKTDFKKCI